MVETASFAFDLVSDAIRVVGAHGSEAAEAAFVADGAAEDSRQHDDRARGNREPSVYRSASVFCWGLLELACNFHSRNITHAFLNTEFVWGRGFPNSFGR
jgi:hypothetical protein